MAASLAIVNDYKSMYKMLTQKMAKSDGVRVWRFVVEREKKEEEEDASWQEQEKQSKIFAEIYDYSGEHPANQRAANCSAGRAQPERYCKCAYRTEGSIQLHILLLTFSLSILDAKVLSSQLIDSY